MAETVSCGFGYLPDELFYLQHRLDPATSESEGFDELFLGDFMGLAAAGGLSLARLHKYLLAQAEYDYERHVSCYYSGN